MGNIQNMNVFVLTLNDINEIIKEEEMLVEEAMEFYFNKKDDSGNSYFIATKTGKEKFKKKEKILSTFDSSSVQDPSFQEPSQ